MSSSPILATGSPRRSSKASSEEAPSYAPISSPLLSRIQGKRFGSFDGEMPKVPESPHRYQFRACSIAAFAGSPERVNGLPYLRFSTGQVLFIHTNARNLKWWLKRTKDGWREFPGAMKLDGYQRVIVLRFSCEYHNDSIEAHVNKMGTK
jgi:hypothetical protein